MCDKHAEMFDREWNAWVMLSTETDPPAEYVGSVVRPSRGFATMDRAAEAARVKELRERIQEREMERQAAEFAARRAAEIEKQQTFEREDLARRSIPGAAEWRISYHARERMVERNFTIEEVLRAACQPDHTYDQPWRGQSNKIFQRADCRLAVDVARKTIITVIDRHDTLETAEAFAGRQHDMERTAQ